MRAMIIVGVAAASVACGPAAAAQGRVERAPARVELLPPETFADAVKRSELRERAIEGLMELAAHPEAQVRANAIEGLAQAPGRAAGVVRAGLADKNLGVRFAAAYAAGRWGIGDVVPSVERLLRDPSADVRAAALYALKKNGVEVDLTPLASMLESGEVRLRRNAAMILGDLGDASATGMLNAAAKSAKQPGMPSEQRITRLIIAEALVKLGDPEAIHAIRAALFPATDRDVEAAVSAAQSLGLLKDRDSVGELVNRIEYRVTPEAQEKAVAPGGGGGEGSGGGAMSARDAAKYPYAMPAELRLAAAQALGRMGYREGSRVAEQYWRAPRAVWRAQAAMVLGETAGIGELPVLEAMMRDESAVVRVSACSAGLKALDRIAETGR